MKVSNDDRRRIQEDVSVLFSEMHYCTVSTFKKIDETGNVTNNSKQKHSFACY